MSAGIADRHADGGLQQFDTAEGFAEALRCLPIPWTFKTPARDFRGAIEFSPFDDANLASVRFASCRCERPEGDLGSKASRFVCLTAQREGTQRLTWDNHEEWLAPSELILWDAREAMALQTEGMAWSYNLWLPLERIERRMGDVRPFIGQKMAADEPAARMLYPFLDRLHAEMSGFEERVHSGLLDATIELIFSCFQPTS